MVIIIIIIIIIIIKKAKYMSSVLSDAKRTAKTAKMG
jgi:hypothetical protein